MRFAFIYTREAHPGERWPHHGSFEQKLDQARQMVAKWSIRRPMLVDDMEGTVHRSYGSLPNMAFVVDRGGRLVYKADWTDAVTIGLATRQLLDERKGRSERRAFAPYSVEWQPQRVNEREPFMEGLLEAGPRAVEEFIAAVRNVRGELAARSMQTWWDARREDR